MTTPEILAAVARAIAFAGIVVVTGAVVFHWIVLRRAARTSTLPPLAGVVAAACIMLVSPLRLYEQARALVDASDPVAPMMHNVLNTAWGHTLLLQDAAALLALLAFVLAMKRMSAGWWLTLVPALALCCTPAYMGHAAAVEQYVAVSIVVDCLHVMAASAWVGALFLLALVIHSVKDFRASGDTAAALIDAFHPVAQWSVVTLVVTGVMSLSFRVLHFTWLLHSEYGALFAIKLALTLLVAAVGFHHSRNGAERARASGAKAVTTTLLVECALAACVIAATSVLVATSPPMS